MAINPSKLFRISVRPVMIKIFATPDSSPNTVAAALRLCFESFRRRILDFHRKTRKDQTNGRGGNSGTIRKLLTYCNRISTRKINCHNFMLFRAGRHRIIWYFTSHASKSPDMIVKVAALYVMLLTPCFICKTTGAAFLNQRHPFLIRTSWVSLNHSCPTPFLCIMSVLDRMCPDLNQTCPLSKLIRMIVTQILADEKTAGYSSLTIQVKILSANANLILRK